MAEQSERDIHDRIRREFENAFSNAQVAPETRAPNVTIDIGETSPYVAIRHASDGTDLLVMGTHSKAPWQTGLEIGALAQRMLAEAPCDVLMSRGDRVTDWMSQPACTAPKIRPRKDASALAPMRAHECRPAGSP
jgi:hypothetical protein